MTAIEVPHTALQPETLRRLLEEFISREGTDYGHEQFTMDEKVAQVQTLLERKRATIIFDDETDTFSIERR